MNDHDNAADDKAMLERIKELGRAAWDDHHHGKLNQADTDSVYGEMLLTPREVAQVELALADPAALLINRINPKTGRLITRADLDQWNLPYPPDE